MDWLDEVYEDFPMGIFVLVFLVVAAGALVYYLYLGSAGEHHRQAPPNTKPPSTKMRCIVTNESIVTGNTLARSGEWREFDLECVEIDKP